MNPEAYAKAMMSLSSKEGQDADSIVKGLVSSLKARGALALLPKVLSAYTNLVAQRSSEESTVAVARSTDAKGAIELSGAPKDAKVIVDERLIGGYRLEKGGKLIDNTFKAKLLQIYRNATKA